MLIRRKLPLWVSGSPGALLGPDFSAQWGVYEGKYLLGLKFSFESLPHDLFLQTYGSHLLVVLSTLRGFFKNCTPPISFLC